ncbi:hypothetical protein T439DRAFT_360880 [Meredithblackwellia eburnea MCA 4105]
MPGPPSRRSSLTDQFRRRFSSSSKGSGRATGRDLPLRVDVARARESGGSNEDAIGTPQAVTPSRLSRTLSRLQTKRPAPIKTGYGTQTPLTPSFNSGRFFSTPMIFGTPRARIRETGSEERAPEGLWMLSNPDHRLQTLIIGVIGGKILVRVLPAAPAVGAEVDF